MHPLASFCVLNLSFAMHALSTAPSAQSLDYFAVADRTDDVRLWILGGKPVNGTDEEYQYQYEVVHSKDTEATANASDCALLQYWQGYHYRDTIHLPELEAWNDSYAPFTSWTPTPSIYQPTSLARHVWKSLDALKATQQSQAYLNSTGKHVFARPDNYLALLTPLARLVWNSTTKVFDDDSRVNDKAKVHVGLFLADSSEGASHEDIYRTLQIRRAYIESVLREEPNAANGLLNFVQSGKSLRVGKHPADTFGPIFENSIFANMTVWQHVAVEDFFFEDATSAARLMQKLPWLSDLLWPGSSGSFALTTKLTLQFDRVGEL